MPNSTRYPLYIPSKGRYEKGSALTVSMLRRDHVPFYIAVEPQEAEHYERLVRGSEGEVLVLPFSDLGLGSIPARNWCRDHAEERGHKRSWSLDDNVIEMRRLWKGKRIPCDAGAAFRLIEDFTDRFSNVGVSGANYQMFCPSETAVPFYRNVHVYSASLVNHAMPYRWRGKYNEDTDLCLQGLANGWATLLLNAVMANKLKTMASKGGNAAIYDMGDEQDEMENHTDTDGRYAMARALEKLWPGVVKVSSRFGRYQHHVNWGAYERVPLKLREDFDYDALPEVDERDFRLRPVAGAPKSPQLRELLATFEEEALTTPAPDLWKGMPAFAPFSEPKKRKVVFDTVAEQEAFVRMIDVTIAKRTGPALSVWWPKRDRQDLASLRFDSTLRSAAPPIVDMPEEEIAEIALAIEEAHAEQFVGQPVVADGEQVGVVVAAEFVPNPVTGDYPDDAPPDEPTEEEAELIARAEEELGDVPPEPVPIIMRPTFGSPPRPSSYDVYD